MTQRSHYLDLFITNTVGAQVRWRFHRRQAKELQEMILHHIAEGPCGFVVSGTTFHTEGFCCRNLHVIDVVCVPEWGENRVGKAKHKDVLRRFLAQEMINSVR